MFLSFQSKGSKYPYQQRDFQNIFEISLSYHCGLASIVNTAFYYVRENSRSMCFQLGKETF